MKKILLALSALAIGCISAVDTKAQLALTNFNTGIPNNWVMVKADSYVPNSGLNATIVTKLTSQAWMAWPRTGGDSCALTVSYFTSPAKADRWLISPAFTVNNPNTVLTWEDYAPDDSYPDSVQVWISTNAGTTPADFTTKLYDMRGSSGEFVKKGVNLGSAYNGQTVRVAFRNNCTDQYVLMLDNIQTEVPAFATDAKLDAIDFKTVVASTSSTPVRVTVQNNGANTITSLNLSYKIDAGTPTTQTFSSLNIPPYSSAVLIFTTPVTNPSVGSHTITAEVVQVNGAADGNAANNQASRPFAVASQTVPRAGIIEEFSSSTCPPCASFNATFDPLIVTTNHANDAASNFNVIKYQMNWPSPNNDRSYNNYGLNRRTYYGVNAIPDHYTNGALGGNGDQAEINASKSAPAYMAVSGTYIIESGQLKVNVSVTPYFTITGSNIKVRIAAVEEHYSKTENTTFTTSQTEFYHVMRTMFPDGDGTAVANWTAGTPQTFTFSKPFAVGNPQQMNEEFWGHPIGSNLVVFIQDDNTGEIYQSASFHAQWSTGVTEVAGIEGLSVFPNPANDFAVVGMTLKQSGKVNVELIDGIGRVVYNAQHQMGAGANEIRINTSAIPAGLYNLRLTTEKGSATQKLSVVK